MVADMEKLKNMADRFATKYLSFLSVLNKLKLVNMSEVDKQLHFIVSFLLVLILYPIVGSWGSAAMVTWAIGFLKETVDNPFCVEDMKANLLGVIFTLPLLLL